MPLSISNILVGLVVGVVVGYGASHYVQRDDAQLSLSSGSNTALSSTPKRAIPDKNRVSPVNGTSASALKQEAISARSNPLPILELESSSLKNHQSYANGFSAELALMNTIGSAPFDQLESLAYDLIDEQPDIAWAEKNSLSMIALRMLELDRDRTLTFLQSALPAQTRSHGRYGLHDVIVSLASTHHDELLDWASSLSNASDKYQLQEMIFSGMAKLDPEVALARYAQYNAEADGMSAHSILYIWAESDPQAAMQWATEQPESNRGFGYSEMIFTRWLETDSAGANAYLEGVTDPVLKVQMESQAIMMLANRDPQSALVQALALDEPAGRRMAIEAAMYSWSERSLLEAIDYATHSLQGTEQELAFQVLGSTVSMNGGGQLGESPLEIMQSADSLPPRLRDSVRHHTMYSLFEQDPQAAMQWLESVPDQQEKNQLLAVIAWEIPEYDLDMALALFEQSDQYMRPQLGSAIAQKLYQEDPMAAWNWHQQITDEAVKEEVFYILVHAQAQSDPDEAMRLALSGTGERGEQMAYSVFSAVAFENPEWARAWLEQSDFDEALKADMRAMLEQANYMGGMGREFYGTTEYRIEQPYIEPY